jgi:glycosyltransferase involved in cell wall biosynthesis
MSVGLPVVATNIAGIPDVVKDGETGFIVEPANVGELASKISEIVNNQSLWAKMSENCLREVEKYSWDNIIKRIEEVYDLCAG